MKQQTDSLSSSKLFMVILVAALGYFVDIYDLVLFSIVRVASLKSLGLDGSALLETGVFLINSQMTGMLLGGVIWGIVGDKRGRLSVLFGSIFLYSIANIANAFVQTPFQYGILRFIAGVGLAGELGAAITLISEIMSSRARGYGTAIVAGVGVSGAVGAALVGQNFSWQVAYIVGGVLGLGLLFLRIGIAESGMFKNLGEHSHIRRGDLLMLFQSRVRFFKYLKTILIGVPIWFVIGVLVTFSPEICKELGVQDPVSAGTAIMMTYIGLVVGDLFSGLLSQLIHSRKKVVIGFVLLTMIFVWISLFVKYDSAKTFYGLCLALGFAIGYWAVFMTVASEQFGTNLRATVTTTAPNFVRGSVVPLTTGFQLLKNHFSLAHSAFVVGFGCIVLALISGFLLEETYGKDLNYFELDH